MRLLSPSSPQLPSDSIDNSIRRERFQSTPPPQSPDTDARRSAFSFSSGNNKRQKKYSDPARRCQSFYHRVPKTRSVDPALRSSPSPFTTGARRATVGASEDHNASLSTLHWLEIGTPSEQGRKSTKRENTNHRQPPLPSANGTYLHHLCIGDVGSVQDMRLKSDPVRVSLLQIHNFAFVRRSDGQWTYAILAYREGDAALIFVVDTDGGTKTVRRGRWHSHIRLVNGSPRNHSDVNDFSSTDTDVESSLAVDIDVLSLFDDVD